MLLALLVACAGAATAVAATEEEPGAPEATAAPTPTPTPTPIPIPQVTGEAEKIVADLRRIEETVAPTRTVEEIRSELPQVVAALDVQGRRVASRLAAGVNLEGLDDQERRWRSIAAPLPDWIDHLTLRGREVEEAIDQLKRLRRLWRATEELAQTSEAPRPIRERIDDVEEQIAAVRKLARERRADVLTLQSEVASQQSRVDEGLAEIARLRELLVSRVLARNAPPLWSPALRQQLSKDPGGRAATALAQELTEIRIFVAAHRGRIVLHLAVAVGLVFLMRSARERVRRRASEETGLDQTAELFEYPYSVGALLAIVLTVWFYPVVPPALSQLLGFAALLPTILILRRIAPEPFIPVLYALVAFYLVDRLRGLAISLPVVARLIFTLELLAAVLLLGWMLRPSRLVEAAEAAPGSRLFRALGGAVRAAFALMLTALVAEIAGYSEFARLVGSAVLRIAYAGVVAYGAVQVLDALVTLALRIPPLRLLAVVRRNRARIRQRVRAIAQFAALVAWSLFALERFQIREPLLERARAVLEAEATFGSITISLGEIAAFALTIWVAFALSKLIRWVLEDDVYPRLKLGRGVPYALSNFIHYGILLLGFFLAVAATGTDLDRFALLAGAFGVGIGFGLQNVVNNFVSGLILLSERPVQVGDTVETTDVFGEVKRIGIRSSTIRTWQGAEVIVPNSQLISEQVVNWTLSDRHRRIEIKVGVAYGTDPSRVLELLLEVGRSHPEVMGTPAPAALFTGFGDSSLDFELRVWANHFEDFLRIQSEVMVQINDALKREGIEIPFPQRDLHVRSVAPKAGQALRGPEAAEEDDS